MQSACVNHLSQATTPTPNPIEICYFNIFIIDIWQNTNYAIIVSNINIVNLKLHINAFQCVSADILWLLNCAHVKNIFQLWWCRQCLYFVNNSHKLSHIADCYYCCNDYDYRRATWIQLTLVRCQTYSHRLGLGLFFVSLVS